MLRFIRRHWILCLILTLVLYVAVGAVAPFIVYKTAENASQISLEDPAVFGEDQTADRVMLLETNQSAWTERIRLLDQAQDRIILSTFDMRPDESTQDILSIIQKKADQGVSVRILVDGFSGLVRMENSKLFHAVAAHPNVEIRLYNPISLLTPWTTQGRMHDKYVIVDDLAYILGGRNTFDYFIGEYDTTNNSYDREVLVYNTKCGTEESSVSSLHEVEAYFESVWNLDVCRPFHDDEALLGETQIQEWCRSLSEREKNLEERYGELFQPPDYANMTHETEGICLLSNPTDIYGKEPVAFQQLTDLMIQAQERVIIHTPYAVLNKDMREKLTEVADQVPDTRLVINSVENGDNFFASSDYQYNKQKVIDTGLQLYEYDGGTSYHAKSIVIDDDISIIGSYNLIVGDREAFYIPTDMTFNDTTKRVFGKESLEIDIKHLNLFYLKDSEDYPPMSEVTKIQIKHARSLEFYFKIPFYKVVRHFFDNLTTPIIYFFEIARSNDIDAKKAAVKMAEVLDFFKNRDVVIFPLTDSIGLSLFQEKNYAKMFELYDQIPFVISDHVEANQKHPSNSGLCTDLEELRCLWS